MHDREAARIWGVRPSVSGRIGEELGEKCVGNLTAIVVGEGAAALACGGAGDRCRDPCCVRALGAVVLTVPGKVGKAGAWAPGDHHGSPGRVVSARALTVRLCWISAGWAAEPGSAGASVRADNVRASPAVQTRAVP